MSIENKMKPKGNSLLAAFVVTVATSPNHKCQNEKKIEAAQKSN